MSKKSADAGEVQKHKTVIGNPESTEDDADSPCDENEDAEDNESSEEDEDNEQDGETSCKMWLEVLPSKGGLLLAVLLAEIMTEGLTPAQMGLLSAFIVSVGDLIGYKATRESLLSD